MIDNLDGVDHFLFMKEALKEAKEAGDRGDRPIGCVIVHNGKIISRGSNRYKTMDSHVEHAEMNAIFNCASYLKKHSRECILYTTVEPCVMCLSTIVVSNIRNVVFAVEDKYMNMTTIIESNPYIKNRLHHYIGGILEEESINLLNTYDPLTAGVVLTGKLPTL
ncbi:MULTISPECIES: nucleoside deaminase [unclassified Bacillus (in: firmicutes)]|uniref:nucleoside deaminase n=1 Tax=unclassified Bacillus (in: firmicutes) TaxID=185979 RepID=UPI0008EE5AF5|nr:MULTISPECIES: nucleoside deaminase [unclassified Bacillus (in: firmicutes)]SFA69803.1 tRNA-adenosine deaminase subunit Tad2p [Bacillus sp. UNCCL13]SFQ59178.1 tRNA-adenosine deaminase subunit Tad2p [Bacillus sp. cl95]